MTTSLGAFDMMHSATMQWDMADWNMHGSGQPIEGVFNTGVFYTPWSAADLALFHSHGARMVFVYFSLTYGIVLYLARSSALCLCTVWFGDSRNLFCCDLLYCRLFVLAFGFVCEEVALYFDMCCD